MLFLLLVLVLSRGVLKSHAALSSMAQESNHSRNAHIDIRTIDP